MSKKALVFNLVMCASAITEAMIGLKDVQGHKDALNGALRQAKQAGIKWGSQRPKDEGSLAYAIGQSFADRGMTADTVKVTLACVHWCYDNSVVLTTTTLSSMKKYADKGAVTDLITGKPKTIKSDGGKGKAASKTKTEAVVKHCGYGLLAALEQDGFAKWIEHMFNRAEIMGIDSTSDVEEMISLVRGSLIDCGYATTNDKDEVVVKVIAVSDNESEEAA